MARPELSEVLVTGALPGHRFGEVSRPTGEMRTVTISLRIWPGKPLTAERVRAVVFDEHKVDLLTCSLTWEVLPA